MHLRTLLNKTYPHKGFIYDSEQWSDDQATIFVKMRPRKGSRGICPHCGTRGPTYDTQPVRHFHMISVLSIAVTLLYAPRRLSCPQCQRVVTESLPWTVHHKSPLTTALAHHLAGWARLLSWKEVAKRCRVSWRSVADSVQWLVDYGLKHRCLDGISAIGVDEIQHAKGHQYSTLVYQIDEQYKRLLWIGTNRTKETFAQFFDMMGNDRCEQITHICSDMWKPYLAVIAERIPDALNILDRFHIAQKLNEAVEQTRRTEVKTLREQGKEPLLTKSRWVWLKRPCHLRDGQRSHLKQLLQYNLRTVKAYLLKESFDQLWSYTSPVWAGKFLKKWCRDVMRYRSLPDMKKFVGTIRDHEDLILNYFRAKSATGTTFSSGVVEGFNNKVKLSLRKSYGYRTDAYLEVALYHALGKLPEPEKTHRFS